MSSLTSVEVGMIVEGTVTGISNFGAFVALPGGKTGMVHISEVADVFVRDIREFIQEQQKVMVKVVSQDERGKVALSLRQANPSFRPEAPRPRERRGGQSFEDKLAKFLRESEDKMSDLRRVEGKRGGRGGRQGL